MAESAQRDVFRTRVRAHLRDLGRTQKELARELGLHPNRLSHKLGGTDGAVLTREEVKRLVETLAAWQAITTQQEAIDLLELAGLRRESFTPGEWSDGPLAVLDSAHPPVLPTPSAPAAAVPVPPDSAATRDGDGTAVRNLSGGTRLPPTERADYGIVTALTDELTAVLEQLEDLEDVPGGAADRRYYYRGSVHCKDGSMQSVVCVCTNGMGQQAALNATRDLLAAWHPRHILLVGIAGGLACRGVAYGDLIVPRFVHYYEPGKLTPEGTRYRTRSFEPSLALQPAADALEVEQATRGEDARWVQLIRVPRPDKRLDLPRVHREELATGEQLWADLEAPVVREVLSQHEKVVGIENEAVGVFNAVREATEHADVLVIKAASDLIEGKDDTWRGYAAAVAAAFTRGLIERVGARWETVGDHEVRGGTSTAPAVLTFLIADVRGYTRFTMEQGDEAAARLTGRFAELCEDVIAAHGGQVAELRGDEALCVFPSARAALRAAIALQATFGNAMREVPSLPLEVGIGLDAGEAIPVKGGYRGGALNLAARLCSIAGPGEVFASQTVIGLAGNVEEIVLLDRGAVDLKGITTPVRVIQVTAKGNLPEVLPPLQSRQDLDPSSVQHPPTSAHLSAPAARTAALPIPPTSLVGREQDVIAVRDLLGQTRLLTLTGTGGAGKTRLALQVATEMRDHPADGVVFVPLADIADAGLVPAVVAQALDLRQGARDLPALVAYLQDKQMLLVLDNFEHVLTAASVVEQLVAACPRVTILVTSRVPLRLYGEHEYRVPPLAASGAMNEVAPAVQLFLQRARAVRPGFALSPDTMPVVEQICVALDGLPLAIELAAARTKLFTPQAMLSRLCDRLSLLTGGARNLPERQQTLRGTLDWSHALLGAEERTLFRRLAVFSGFDPESVEAVCETDADTLDRLVDLADQSLLEYVPVDEDVRFRMLQTVRDYATARLAESGEAATVRQRHAERFLRLAEEAELHLIGPDQLAWTRRLDREHDNLRAALSHLLETAPADALRLATLLNRYWGRRGYQAEGRFWFDAALERFQPSQDLRAQELRAKALVADGVMTADLREFDCADALLGEAMAIYESLGDGEGVAATLDAMGEPAFIRGDVERSTALREQALAMYREMGNRWGTADALSTLTTAALAQLDLDRASRLLDESVALFQELGDRWRLASLLTVQAALQFFSGEREGSLILVRESIRMSQELGDEVQAAQSLLGLAVALSELGDKKRAARVWGAAEAVLRRTSVAVGTILSVPATAQIRAIVEDSAYASDIETGHALSLDEAVALAFEEETALA